MHEHDYFMISMNPSPLEGEPSVLFSGEAQTVPLHKMGPAVHDYTLLHTVLSGRGTFSIGGRTYACRAGDTFVIFPGELFFYQADEHQPWTYAWVALVGRGTEELLAGVGATPADAVIAGSLNDKVRSYYAQLRECFPTEAQPELANLEAGGWARLLLRQFGLAKRRPGTGADEAATEKASDYVVKQAVQYLTFQYARTISIEQMSAMLGYHRTHLCKLFKQATGLSPMQYLMNVRMTRAEQLLDETAMTVEQIASSVGIGDALYFSKKFRKRNGRSPTEYRKALRTGSERSNPATDARISLD
ncbi:AraC family transcriptional regulator [Cohnella suwonensis]|uniref:AraC family transcriptional regulator n=1 Tax=Cohnella suwonensis TaxID=696072 RepID=A0ABW0M0A4_9BACL